MSFDQLQRYRLAADLIEAVRGGKPLSILDAGSREGFLGNFLPYDRIIGIDRSDFPEGRFIKGDVLSLPFRDGSFDIVLTLDVLEHIPDMERINFLLELERVSSEIVIVGSPFNSEPVEEAERLINDFSRKLTGDENIFLSEHEIIGLPDLDKVLDWALDRGDQTVVIPNGYLPRWILMMALNQYLERLPDAWDLIFSSNRLYHNRYYRDDNSSPAYRQMILISKDNKLDDEKICRDIFGQPASNDRSEPSAFKLIKDIIRVIESEKDALIIKLSEEKESLTGKVAALERKSEDEVNLLTAIIEEKTGELSEIQKSRAYQTCRKIFSLFDRSQP